MRHVEAISGQCEGFCISFFCFNNWKDATVGFASHEKSVTHRRAVEAVITIPQTTRNVGEMLSSAHAEEQC